MMFPNPWLILAVLLAIGGSGAAGYWKGHHDADRSAEITRLHEEASRQKAAAEETRRQAEAAQRNAAEAAQRERDALAESDTLKAKVDDYAARLQAAAAVPAPVVNVVRPADPPPLIVTPAPDGCALDDADLSVLRSLRHKAGTGDHPRAAAPAGRPLDIRPSGPAAGAGEGH